MKLNCIEEFEEDLVSIIIPVFNGEKTVERCLNSVIFQTYKNLEIIIIDDGSSDKSVEICKEIIKFDPKFKLYVKNNGGVSSARNLALKKMNGSFVVFLDCDDFIHETYIERMVNAANNWGLDIVISSFENLRIKHEIDYQKYFNKSLGINNTEILKPDDALEKMLLGNNFRWEACGKIFKEKILKDVFFDESEVIFEDFSYTCKALANSKKIGYIDSRMYFYVDNHNSASKQVYNEKLKSVNITVGKFEKIINQNFPKLQYCSLYFKSIIYTDMYDRILAKSTGFINFIKSYSSNVDNIKFFYRELGLVKNELIFCNYIPKKKRIKFLFMFNKYFFNLKITEYDNVHI